MQRTALLLRDLLADYPERAELARDLLLCEQEGDRITHDIIHRLNGGRRRRMPIESADGYALATALDDIVDYAEQTADALGLYRVEAPMEQAVALADVLVGASEQVAQALRAATGADCPRSWSRSTGWRTRATGSCATASPRCSSTGIDPMVVIRWKDIFESLEAAVDACETVAHVLEGTLRPGA